MISPPSVEGGHENTNCGFLSHSRIVNRCLSMRFKKVMLDCGANVCVFSRREYAKVRKEAMGLYLGDDKSRQRSAGPALTGLWRRLERGDTSFSKHGNYTM